MKHKLYIFVCLLTLVGCFEYSPNQIILDDSEKNLTAKNIQKLGQQAPSDTLTIAFMGDSQRWYDEAEDFVSHVNLFQDVDFVLHGGDISDFGLVKEFRWVNEILSELKAPYLTAVGNHDLLANGKKVYTEMYGEYNYAFDYGDFRFIILDTNSREYEFNGRVPDLEWLQRMLDENTENRSVVVASHVPPWDGDFDDNLEQAYAEILANDPNVVLSLHAHTHSFLDREFYNDGVRYFVTTTVQKEGYAILKLSNGGVSIEMVSYDD